MNSARIIILIRGSLILKVMQDFISGTNTMIMNIVVAAVEAMTQGIEVSDFIIDELEKILHHMPDSWFIWLMDALWQGFPERK